MNIKIIFFILISLIISLSYCSIKLFPINDDENYCYNLFSIKPTFNEISILYYPDEDNYIIRKIDNFYSYKDFNVIQGNTNIKNYDKKIDLIHSHDIHSYIILKDKSIIVANKKYKKSKYYLSLNYFKYPPKLKSIQKPDYYYENENIIISLNNDIYIIDCSNMIFIYSFGSQNNGVFLYILDEKLRILYLKEKIENYNVSSLISIYLDKNRNNIITCLSHTLVECFASKYERKLITGSKITIFTDYETDKPYSKFCAMTLIGNNKIALAYITGFEIYYTIIIFNELSLKFGIFQNIKISHGLQSMHNLCNKIINYNKININDLYIDMENILNNKGKLANIFLNGSCNSFIINEIIPYEKYEIFLDSKISKGINKRKETLYFSYINKSIEVYKSNKKIFVNKEFNINDKIYVKIDDSEKPLLLRYNYENEECQIQFNAKKLYIFIEKNPFICLFDKNINEINNIIYNELKDKSFEIYSTEFNFSIIFENEVKEKDLIFYFLNKRINCKKDKINKNKIFCKGFLPKLPPNTFYKHYDIYSKLSCKNMIKVGSIKIRDKYLKQIYDINNLNDITNNINKDYDPTESIKNFSVNMISYYYWFSGFSYCEDRSLGYKMCCQEEILNDWEILEHKEYKISFIEIMLKHFLAYKIGGVFDKIKAFLVSFNPYIYNFIILKSKKYKKFIFGFPGTTGTKQLLFEFLGYSFHEFNSKEPNIKVEKFFYETFKLIYKDLFSNKIIKELKVNSDYQVIFTGHSLGGSIATLASYYYAKNKLSENEPVLITFGQPRVGNENFAKDYMKLMPLVFRVARKGDIVTIIPPARQLKDHKFFSIFSIFDEFRKNLSNEVKKFLNNFSKSNITRKIGNFFEFIFNMFLNLIQFILSLIIGIIAKLPIFPHGYCHIGGLYLLIDNKFYQCEDFYNDQTGHPICDNWEYEAIFDFKNMLDNHSYLRFGENLMGKCQKDKKFWIFL